MELCSDSMTTVQQVSKRKGGLITMPFIIANEAFERVASVGLHINMILYLTGEYHFDNATGASILFWWAAISNFLPTFGAFLSDSYLGRFRVIALGTVVSLLGQAALWLTALLPEARPPHCPHYPDNCAKPNAGQLALLFSAFALMSIGAGGIRPCSLAFGADQFDNPENPKNQRILQSFFNWFFNKACIARNLDGGLEADGSIWDPWKACTVEQVENLKALIKVLPIWSTSIMIAVTISQNSFPLLQAGTMDRRIIGNFKIPPAWLYVFAVLTMGIWVAIYDRILVPWLAKYTKHKRGLSFELRIGTGLFLSCLATGMAAAVERTRRNRAISLGLAENPLSVVNMSVFWLAPQYCMTGLAEAFNAIGQIEFYYAHFPKSMASIGVALFALGLAVGNLVASLIVLIVDHASKTDGKPSWVSNNLNEGHYDYYYWVLCLLSFVNFFYFIFLYLFVDCYGEEKFRDNNEGECMEEKEEASAKSVSNVF
ncbi:protein NRT1/ PTR FAMILY 1.2-like isoform X2 [Coffea arabica]|uniref:Protein NRT1/ PTR FAMILY 1.2-like isoform X2 n=1 Tax=Coffea arabica TaxID=13443 RepID=A0ABM4UNC4_COFAR